ncbi:MAG TPA: flavodoxin domain-containing protein [bacterium]|nr:flavodoxin domain-containing protein [bacterium]HQO35979.1 flavodoxin domain-containing protein [bacterium]HQP99744.1 flavodoxin domain-containing protein [bacterium]
MPKVLITYFSHNGHTEKLARIIAEGVRDGGIEVTVKPVNQAEPTELLQYDGIIVGSPAYYGAMAAPVKRFFDDTAQFHGRLDGKAGSAFASSANLASGAESTVTGILQALLAHGMIIQGDPRGNHFGSAALEQITPREEDAARRQGQRFADLVMRLAK